METRRHEYCDVFTPCSNRRTQKSVNTLLNNRGSGVYSVPFRAAGG
jgi:predicted RNase H-like nuclease